MYAFQGHMAQRLTIDDRTALSPGTSNDKDQFEILHGDDSVFLISISQRIFIARESSNVAYLVNYH